MALAILTIEEVLIKKIIAKVKHDLIDDIENDSHVVVNSKLSIVLTCVLLSPLMGTLLFLQNLYLTHQKKSILGISLLSLLFTCFLYLGFLGLFSDSFHRLMFNKFLNLVMGLFLIGPLWKIKFKPNIPLKQVFKPIAFLALVMLTLIIGLLHYDSSLALPEFLLLFLISNHSLLEGIFIILLLTVTMFFLRFFMSAKQVELNVKNHSDIKKNIEP